MLTRRNITPRVVCCPWEYFNENNKESSSYGLIIDTDRL